MKATRSYRSRSRAMGAQHTRERIVTAVRELLREQRFHESTVEQVAERAGVSRATVYQHFRSRIDLVDAICETFDANPALIELRRVIMLPDPQAALMQTIALAMRFWESEDAKTCRYGVYLPAQRRGWLRLRARALQQQYLWQQRGGARRAV